MSKKSKILELFDSVDWRENITGDHVKTITHDMFYEAGLCPTMEYGERYNDIIYARSIFRKMGYKVGIGMAFHIFKINQPNT